ncbi:hypothetical protein BDB01DRAFT_802237 [Pilobolus umbonatus]|nr:hypothetical protein BDB01DRAFT_802237 [Pilobolus umbonatus]
MCVGYMIYDKIICIMALCVYNWIICVMVLNVYDIVCCVIRWIDYIESISYVLYVMLIFYGS